MSTEAKNTVELLTKFIDKPVTRAGPVDLLPELIDKPAMRGAKLLETYFELRQEFKELDKGTPANVLILKMEDSPANRKQLIEHRLAIAKLSSTMHLVIRELMTYLKESSEECYKAKQITTDALSESMEKKERLEVLDRHAEQFVKEFNTRCQPFAKENEAIKEMIKDKHKVLRNGFKSLMFMSNGDDYASVPEELRQAYELSDIQGMKQQAAAQQMASPQANGKKK